MIKVLVVSDNHGDDLVLQEILNKHYDCDYYLHLGDSCMPPEALSPFISVLGNNDYGFDYPKERVINISGIDFYMFHGAHDNKIIADKGIIHNCKYVLCGHTHIFCDYEAYGVRILNPGSCYYNRDYTSPSYAIMTIDDDLNVEFERINLEMNY